MDETGTGAGASGPSTAPRRFGRRRALLGGGVAVVALMIGMVSMAAPAHAAPGDDVASDAANARVRPHRPQPEVVAIAMGTVNEDDGSSSWLSMRAGSAGDRVGGNLRFYCREAGFYNGVVRPLTVEGGAIHAEGSGGLWRPDNTRIAVRFTLDVSPDGRTTLSVVGRGYEYSMSGVLDGFIYAGSPPAQTDAAS